MASQIEPWLDRSRCRAPPRPSSSLLLLLLLLLLMFLILCIFALLSLLALAAALTPCPCRRSRSLMGAAPWTPWTPWTPWICAIWPSGHLPQRRQLNCFRWFPNPDQMILSRRRRRAVRARRVQFRRARSPAGALTGAPQLSSPWAFRAACKTRSESWISVVAGGVSPTRTQGSSCRPARRPRR